MADWSNILMSPSLFPLPLWLGDNGGSGGGGREIIGEDGKVGGGGGGTRGKRGGGGADMMAMQMVDFGEGTPLFPGQSLDWGSALHCSASPCAETLPLQTAPGSGTEASTTARTSGDARHGLLS